ncbi:MAG: helix-turn-helix domain-containing protein [Prevotellaceae bacterium]|jgi:transcriptional regulator with XRE-family HTH domain|nr:helix-turn-helix domain-containing protein [Prevotellaceae bacterium]
MDIVDYIKKEAKIQGLGVTGLAEKMDMSQQNLSKMLNADSIKFSIVQKIAGILGVSVGYLLGENTNSDNSMQRNNVGHNLQFNGKTVKENNISINDCFDLVAEKERIISELDTALKQKDLIIADGSNALKEKDAVIREKEDIIKEKDNLIVELLNKIDKKDEKINTLNDRIFNLLNK